MKTWLKKRPIIATLIPVVLVMVMIFCFSAQNGSQSGQLSGRITRWVLGLVIWDFDAWSPELQTQVASNLGLVIRKMGHFSEFFLLGFFLLPHLRAVGEKITVRLPWLWSWGIGTAYAITDELHQGFVGGRHPAVPDVCIDSSGVIVGVLVAWLLLRRRKTKKE
ncbi:MAG: VanZ family protein [Ruminococcaceae bacterium]|nr:VanZ family protein [Oscillospiraceae bacterium]